MNNKNHKAAILFSFSLRNVFLNQTSSKRNNSFKGIFLKQLLVDGSGVQKAENGDR